MVKFDTEAAWWPAFKEELLEFDRGTHDDMVDAFAWLGIGISQQAAPMNAEEQDEEEELLSLRKRYERDSMGGGRSTVTGY